MKRGEYYKMLNSFRINSATAVLGAFGVSFFGASLVFNPHHSPYILGLLSSAIVGTMAGVHAGTSLLFGRRHRRRVQLAFGALGSAVIIGGLTSLALNKDQLYRLDKSRLIEVIQKK